MIVFLVEELVHEEDDCVELVGFIRCEMIVLVEQKFVLEAALLYAINGLANRGAEVDAVSISHETWPEMLILHGLAQQHKCPFRMSQQVFLISEHITYKSGGHMSLIINRVDDVAVHPQAVLSSLESHILVLLRVLPSNLHCFSELYIDDF